MRYFNTAGPCLPDVHYMLPPEPRLPEARGLIARSQYFVVHAPRQTGKTTTLRALAAALTAEGRYAALHFSCEVGRATGDDYEAALRGILSEIRSGAEYALEPDLRPPRWPDAPAGTLLKESLTAWAQACPRPLVLFFDEIDALVGQSLISVLSQVRAGYNSRPAPFPAGVVLCGLRDVREYKAASGGDPSRLGTSSPFNIKIRSLRIGDFTEADVYALYAQHTEETGQPFTEAALARAYDYTRGQPWLVNALAAEIVDQIRVEPPDPITADHVDEAKERLILGPVTLCNDLPGQRGRAALAQPVRHHAHNGWQSSVHLDSLVARLGETRVRRVVEPLIAGDAVETDSTFNEDVAYLSDLGLVAPGWPVTIANPIYREVIVRVLGAYAEAQVVADPRSFVLPDGRLDFRMLLEEFAGFWRQHGEVLTSAEYYHEVAPQLVLMGYLHRIVNGGGYIDREYGVGRGRIDLTVRWPYLDGAGKRVWQREAVELKVWRAGESDPLRQGLQQLDAYLDRLDLDHGTLVVFDRRDPQAPPADRTRFAEDRTPSGRPVTLLRA